MVPAAKSWTLDPWDWLFPPLCQVCRREPASRSEGYVGEGCRSELGALSFLETPFCHVCGLPFEGEIGGEFQCGNCANAGLAFDWARASVVATPLILEVIHRYKYRGHRWYEPFLTALVEAGVPSDVACRRWDAILPVPLHRGKFRERGFNQAERVARVVARVLDVPVETGWLRRVRRTDTQTRLTRSQRRLNVDGAFRADENRRGLIRGRSLLLVDDILTTGATTSACARALRRLGAARIGVWTLARGL